MEVVPKGGQPGSQRDGDVVFTSICPDPGTVRLKDVMTSIGAVNAWPGMAG